MDWQIVIAIFMAFCAGIGALAVIVKAVQHTIKQEIKPLYIRLERLEKDEADNAGEFKTLIEKLDEIKQNLKSDKELDDKIDLKVAKHKETCPKK